MKTQRKHGFTIVELVIVIAIIAILAAILIPTFVSIIKKANDSAYVQERQSQRIDDIAQKIDNETWVSWEDMEVKIADAIAGINKETVNKDDVSAAIQKALEEYAAAHQSGNTGVTPEQVQKIVEETTKGNVTLEQVQALIAKIPTGTPGVTTAQVQAIVNQALAGVSASAGLNVTQVNNLIKSYLESHPTDNAAAIQSAVASALANVKTLSEADVVEIVNNITNQMNDVTTVLTGVEGNGAGYTSNNNDKVIYLITNRSSTQQYTITSKAGQKVVIDAPNMTNVVVAGESDEVVVFRTAMTSVHITGTVGKVEINSGHVEIESDATVTTVTAAPSTNSTVKVTVKTEATLTNPVDAEYQDHGRGTDDTIIVVIENGATVNGDNPEKVVLSASDELKKSEITTTNVRVTNEDTTPSTNAVVAGDDVKEVLANADVEVVVNDGDSQTVDTDGTLVPRETEDQECKHVGYLIGTYCNKCGHPVAFVDEITDFTVNDTDEKKMPVKFEFSSLSDLLNPDTKLCLDVAYSFKAFPNNDESVLDDVTKYRFDAESRSFIKDNDGAYDAQIIYTFFSNWLCDYFVSFDRGVKAGSCGLGGCYGEYKVGFLAPEDIPANYEIPLLGYMISGGESNWTYDMIANLVSEFKCGFFNLSDENNGKTFTVKLRMTNPNGAGYNDTLGIDLPEYIDVAVTNYVIQAPSAQNLNDYNQANGQQN